MNKTQITKNSYLLENVFEQEFLNELVQYVDTFVPSEVRESYDAPHLPASLDTAKRESTKVSDRSFIRKIAQYFSEIKSVKVIEFWRDYPGFRNEVHCDFIDVENIIIVYLDGSGGKNMGTAVYEDESHLVEYKLNTGIMLLNSNKVAHHMYGIVSEVEYRKTLYINWKSR
jgi:hypothetical protein